MGVLREMDRRSSWLSALGSEPYMEGEKKLAEMLGRPMNSHRLRSSCVIPILSHTGVLHAVRWGLHAWTQVWFCELAPAHGRSQRGHEDASNSSERNTDLLHGMMPIIRPVRRITGRGRTSDSYIAGIRSWPLNFLLLGSKSACRQTRRLSGIPLISRQQ